MKKPNIQELVYNKTYPKPRSNDPTSFVQHIQRCLVPEVREEVQRYFGRIDCIEAQYPGLDYTFHPHQRRLESFPWHRRLFRVFKELRLTNDEILHLCTWEGTRAAKERFERESGTKIEITTLHDVAAAPEGTGPRAIFHNEGRRSQYTPFSDITNIASSKRKADVEDDQSDEDETEESIGVNLNQQLIAAADARERGEPATFNQQWEQWMKEALERNEMDLDTILETIRQGRPFPPSFDEQQPRQQHSTTAQLRPAGSPGLPAEASTQTPTRSNSPSMPDHTEPYDQLGEMIDELTASTVRISAENSRLVARHAELVGNGRQPSDRARISDLVEELESNTNQLEAENAAMQSFLSRTRTETAR